MLPLLTALLLSQAGNSLVWVDAVGTTVSPTYYDAFTDNYLYFDPATGNTWAMNLYNGSLSAIDGGGDGASHPTFYYSGVDCTGNSYVWALFPRVVFQIGRSWWPPPADPHYFVLQDNPGLLLHPLLCSFMLENNSCYNMYTCDARDVYSGSSAHQVVPPAFNFVPPFHIERR